MSERDIPKMLLGPDSVTIHGGGPISEWTLVPRHPTMEMLEAARHACDGINLSKLNRVSRAHYKAAKRWEAMLAAAPVSVGSGNITADVSIVQSDGDSQP